MSDYTAREIEAAVNNAPEGWNELGDSWGPTQATVALRGELVKITVIDAKYPAEGGGEDVHLIVEVGEQFFKKTGYYSSYSNTDWDGSLTEVHAVEKTVTVYE